APGIGSVAHTIKPSTHLKGYGQSDMDAPLWPGDSINSLELRTFRNAPLPPRAFGLVGYRVCELRLEYETHASADDDIDSLPAIFWKEPGNPGRRSGKRLAL